MSTRHTGRRPNRRQIDPTTLYIPPLGMNWMNPTINGPNTVFEGGLNQSRARVATEAGTPEVERIVCAGIFGGTWTEKPALEIANEGESANGTLLQITFDEILDLTQPWELRIPADSPLIQSEHGGRLAGSFTNGQAITESQGGFIRQSSVVETAGALPDLTWPITATVIDPTHINVQFGGGGTSPFTIDSLPPFNDTLAGAPTAVADLGGGMLELTFAGGAAAGSRLSFTPWQPSIRGAGGSWLTPFETLTE